jgi:glucan phosphoethanolaminetransferase (alkaline phosphatase superfamily)
MDGIRNVALITVDCLRADHLPMYGYDRDTAPFLDDLASKSVVFENAFAAGCGTPASFRSIFSSTTLIKSCRHKRIKRSQSPQMWKAEWQSSGIEK